MSSVSSWGYEIVAQMRMTRDSLKLSIGHMDRPDLRRLDDNLHAARLGVIFADNASGK